MTIVGQYVVQFVIIFCPEVLSDIWSIKIRVQKLWQFYLIGFLKDKQSILKGPNLLTRLISAKSRFSPQRTNLNKIAKSALENWCIPWNRIRRQQQYEGKGNKQEPAKLALYYIKFMKIKKSSLYSKNDHCSKK